MRTDRYNPTKTGPGLLGPQRNNERESVIGREEPRERERERKRKRERERE